MKEPLASEIREDVGQCGLGPMFGNGVQLDSNR